jgi:hypothetical protein
VARWPEAGWVLGLIALQTCSTNMLCQIAKRGQGFWRNLSGGIPEMGRDGRGVSRGGGGGANSLRTRGRPNGRPGVAEQPNPRDVGAQPPTVPG